MNAQDTSGEEFYHGWIGKLKITLLAGRVTERFVNPQIVNQARGDYFGGNMTPTEVITLYLGKHPEYAPVLLDFLAFCNLYVKDGKSLDEVAREKPQERALLEQELDFRELSGQPTYQAQGEIE